MNDPIVLRVVGLPVPQGNKSAFVNKATGRAIMREGASADAQKRHRHWRDRVADAAGDWQAEHGDGLLTGPVAVSLSFRLPRPVSAPKRRRTWPTSRPDVDKLARSVLDSLTNTILDNDSRVVVLVADKDYGDPPGVEILIRRVPEGATAAFATIGFTGQQTAVGG